MRSRTGSAVAFIVVLTVVMAFISQAHAAVYTNEGAFKAALTGYRFEDFGGLGPQDVGTPVGFTYTMSAPSGLYPLAGAMSIYLSSEALHIEFTGLPVTAIGGIFWPTDINGDNAVGSITIAFADGTTHTIPNAQFDTFRGFVSTFPFLYVDITSDDSNYWPTVTNLYVGQAAVPLPPSLLLLVPGLGGLLLGRRTFKG